MAKIFRFVFTILLVCNAVCVFHIRISSATNNDTLSPCMSYLMGSEVNYSYGKTLREKIFVETNVASLTELARMIIAPPFSPEEYLVVYKNKQEENIVKYARSNVSILSSVQSEFIPLEHRDNSMPTVGGIQVTTNTKKVSNKLATAIWKLWPKMIAGTRDHADSSKRYIDSTIILFSMGDGTCGATFGVQGERVKLLVEVGNQLKEYAVMSEKSESFENAILTNINTLYGELNSVH